MTLDQLINAYKNVHDGIAPDATAQGRLQYFVNLSANQPADAAAMSYIVNSADSNTAVAVLSYQFFTGKTPTKAGIDYLVNSAVNATDLNDAYYAGFNLENRYMNFAANLGIVGEGAAGFAAKYGAMSYSAYVASIYETIIGSSYAKAAGIDVTAAVNDIISRQAAILASSHIATDGMTAAQTDIALKAATAGYLLGEAIKADIGVYAAAADNFMVAMALGTATYGTDMTTTYAPTVGQPVGGGSAVSPGFTFPVPVVTPPTDTGSTTTAPHSFVLTAGADTFTGGAQNDTFTGVIGTSPTFGASDTLNGGAGDDTLSLTSNDIAILTLDPARITNIEHLVVTATGNTVLMDVAGIAFTDLTHTGVMPVQFSNAAPTSSLIIANTSASTFLVTPSGSLTGASDALTVKLDNVTAAALVSIQGSGAVSNAYETLNIVTSGGASSITLSTDSTQASLSTINISGSANLTVVFDNNDRLLTTATTIDAHALTGNLAITTGTVANTIIGGSGDDTISLGRQTINASSGADVITTGAGADVVRFVGNTAAGTGAATDFSTFAKITDFSVASDKLAFSASDSDFRLTTSNGAGSAAPGLAKGAVAQGLASGDVMVVQTLAQNATSVSATDVSFIKLTTGVTFHTDIKTTFADAIGAGAITGLGGGANYLISAYDTTHNSMILAVVNSGGAIGNTTLDANDFVNADIAVVGVLSMTAGDYATFGAANLGLAF